MLNNNFTLGANVYNADEQKLGTIDRVVIEPKTDEVTHLVVRKGFFFKVDKVISIDLIQKATEDSVILKDSITDLEALPNFEEIHYVEAGNPTEADQESTRAVYWYPPLYPSFYSMPSSQVEVRERNIPTGTVALKKNATVISHDGNTLGKINRVYVNPETEHVEFFVVSQGIADDEKLVPARWIDIMGDEEVRLVLDSTVFNRLPSQEPQS
jgi:uncharacterized protein YrrD